MDLQTIKSWFVRGAKPTASQFATVFDSFRHKDDPLDMDDINGLSNELIKKSNTGHQHSESDITGLSDTLNGKANTNHSHTLEDIENLNDLTSLDILDEDGNLTLEGKIKTKSNIETSQRVIAEQGVFQKLRNFFTDKQAFEMKEDANSICYADTGNTAVKVANNKVMIYPNEKGAPAILEINQDESGEIKLRTLDGSDYGGAVLHLRGNGDWCEASATLASTPNGNRSVAAVRVWNDNYKEGSAMLGAQQDVLVGITTLNSGDADDRGHYNLYPYQANECAFLKIERNEEGEDYSTATLKGEAIHLWRARADEDYAVRLSIAGQTDATGDYDGQGDQKSDPGDAAAFQLAVFDHNGRMLDSVQLSINQIKRLKSHIS